MYTVGNRPYLSRVCVCESLSQVWLCDSMAVAWQAPLSMKFSRQEYRTGQPFPSPGDFHDPVIKPGSPALQVDFLLSPREALFVTKDLLAPSLISSLERCSFLLTGLLDFTLSPHITAAREAFQKVSQILSLPISKPSVSFPLSWNRIQVPFCDRQGSLPYTFLASLLWTHYSQTSTSLFLFIPQGLCIFSTLCLEHLSPHMACPFWCSDLRTWI